MTYNMLVCADNLAKAMIPFHEINDTWFFDNYRRSDGMDTMLKLKVKSHGRIYGIEEPKGNVNLSDAFFPKVSYILVNGQVFKKTKESIALVRQVHENTMLTLILVRM